jgi:hypothetical protein
MPKHPIVDPAGFEADAPGGIGVGVRGKNSIGEAVGELGGTGISGPAGVVGVSNNEGVDGFSKGPVGVGVLGSANQTGNNFDPATGGTGVLGSGYIGVRGETQTGVAVLGRIFGPGLAGRFVGDVEVTGNCKVKGLDTDSLLVNGVGRFEGNVAMLGDIDCSGNINGNNNNAKTTITCFDVILTGGDCAEDFDIDDAEKIEPGTVMVIDKSGTLRACDEAYDKRVAGVISGAGDYKPGIVLDKQQSRNDRRPVALFGKVYCKVDAQYAAIEVGDLLTTSPTSGHAMRAENPLRAFGAVIGKALRPLAAGQGLIPILIALQ